jgi:hypothetical protein
VLFCEKEPEAIKQCIRVNRDVAITLYRDHRLGIGFTDLEPDTESSKENQIVEFPLGVDWAAKSNEKDRFDLKL